MTHGGGEALERRDARVDLTRLETRDGRLRGAHPLGDLALREPERLAPRREVPQEPAAIQRGLDEPGELGVTCRPLRDELVEEVRLAAQPSACHRSRSRRLYTSFDIGRQCRRREAPRRRQSASLRRGGRGRLEPEGAVCQRIVAGILTEQFVERCEQRASLTFRPGEATVHDEHDAEVTQSSVQPAPVLTREVAHVFGDERPPFRDGASEHRSAISRLSRIHASISSR